MAVVTGGTGALGRAVVRSLLDRGFLVWVPWLIDGEAHALQSAVGAASIETRRVDLTREQDVMTFFAEIGEREKRLDVLANIAGGFSAGAIETADARAWHRMMDLNATTAFLCSRYAVPIMRRQASGRIINVSSGPAVNHGAPGMAAYSASKAAVLNLTESLAKELVGQRITVNALVPSVIDTPANRKAMPNADTSTWLQPEEIAAVIEFLASEAAAIVTGSAVTLARS